MFYEAEIAEVDSTFTCRVPAFTNLMVFGPSRQSVVDDARRMILDRFLRYKRSKLGDFPLPQPGLKDGISVDAVVVSKFILWNILVSHGVYTVAEAARRAELSQTTMDRLLNPKVGTRIESIEKELARYGYRLKVSVIPVQ